MTTPGAPMEARAADNQIRRLQAALRVSRGWVITCSESEQARRDLKTIDAALAIPNATAPTPAAEEVERVARALNALDERDHGLKPWDELTDEARAYRMQQAEIALAPSTQLQPGGAGFNETADLLKVADLEAAWREGWANCKDSLTEDEAFCLTEDVERDAWLESATAIRALPLTGAGAGGESNS